MSAGNRLKIILKQVMMMMMMICFCGMVERRKAFSLISGGDNCQRSSPSCISDTPRTGFEPAQSMSSGLVERICTVVITTTPRCHRIIHYIDKSLLFVTAKRCIIFPISSTVFRWKCISAVSFCFSNIMMLQM